MQRGALSSWERYDAAWSRSLKRTGCHASTPPKRPPCSLTPSCGATGTTPIAFAAPTSGAFPVVFDTSSSAIAGFKVRIMAQQGKTLEPNLIVDKDGRPTTDPNDLDRGGALLPFGGHRGYGFALLVE